MARNDPLKKVTSQSVSRPRIALFTHDTFGLGHIKRSSHIIQALSERLPNASLLLISGSPVLHMLRTLPPNADYVKIPTVVKTGAPESQPSHLPLAVSEITWLREQIILQTVQGFGPDVFVADNFPLGSGNELLSTLKELKRSNARTILGVRDIVDAPEVVRVDWQRHGIYDVLDRYYDRILVYGNREMFDVADAYAIPDRISRKIAYCGYLTSPAQMERNPEEIHQELGTHDRMIVVTGGGGGDAFPLFSTFLEALPRLSGFSALLVLGPMMGASDRAKLHSLAAGNPNVILRDSVPDLPRYMIAAEAVVSMCGYNVAAEIVVNRLRAVIVPRTWRYGEHTNRANTLAEGEQIIRAQSFAKMGLALLLEPENLNPEHLAEKILEAIRSPKPAISAGLNVDGLESAVKLIQEMVCT